MVKASDVPLPLLYAFVDTLEAWGLLEHELFMVWQLMKRSPNIGAAWDEFSRLSTSEQRKQTIALIEKFRKKTAFAPSLPAVFGRLVELTKTRDRLVHGRWHPIELAVSGKVRGIEYIRLYDARGEPSRPVDTDDEQRMLGRSRFYEPELKAAEQQFRDAARDIHLAKAAMIGAWHKWTP